MLKNAPESNGSSKKSALKKSSSNNDKYKSVDTYKPGGLIYSNELINSINSATHKIND